MILKPESWDDESGFVFRYTDKKFEEFFIKEYAHELAFQRELLKDMQRETVKDWININPEKMFDPLKYLRIKKTYEDYTLTLAVMWEVHQRDWNKKHAIPTA